MDDRSQEVQIRLEQQPIVHPTCGLSKEWQLHTPTDRLTRHFNLKSNHRSFYSCEGRQSERLFIFISLVSDGLSASWTGGAGWGAGNAADCKDSFRLPSKTEFIDLRRRRQEKRIAAATGDRFWMFLTERSERMWRHLQKRSAMNNWIDTTQIDFVYVVLGCGWNKMFIQICNIFIFPYCENSFCNMQLVILPLHSPCKCP